MRCCAFYGVLAIVVLDAWNKLIFQALVPKGGWLFHVLWMLMFMKLYGTAPDMFANANSSCSALDPNTLMK